MTNLTYNLLPDLIEIQRSSFRWFLETGLIEELNSFSPITDYTGKLELHFIGDKFKLHAPKYDVDEAKRRDASYSVQMYVPTRLINKETGEIKEMEVFIGDLPLILPDHSLCHILPAFQCCLRGKKRGPQHKNQL